MDFRVARAVLNCVEEEIGTGQVAVFGIERDLSGAADGQRWMDVSELGQEANLSSASRASGARSETSVVLVILTGGVLVSGEREHLLHYIFEADAIVHGIRLAPAGTLRQIADAWREVGWTT